MYIYICLPLIVPSDNIGSETQPHLWLFIRRYLHLWRFSGWAGVRRSSPFSLHIFCFLFISFGKALRETLRAQPRLFFFFKKKKKEEKAGCWFYGGPLDTHGNLARYSCPLCSLFQPLSRASFSLSLSLSLGGGGGRRRRGRWRRRRRRWGSLLAVVIASSCIRRRLVLLSFPLHLSLLASDLCSDAPCFLKTFQVFIVCALILERQNDEMKC